MSGPTTGDVLLKSMKSKLIITYFILIHVALFFVIIKSGFVPVIKNKLKGVSGRPELTRFYYRMVGYHRIMDENIPEKSVLFIGDSNTQALAVCLITPLSINLGIGGDTSFGVLKRISNYNSFKRARAVVIAVGFNDLRRRNNEEIFKNYTKISEVISEHTDLIFSGVLPVGKPYNQYKILNKRIQKLNTKLKELCLSRKNRYVEVGSFLSDNQGNLISDYHVGDGIHLNPKGIRIWSYKLQKALETSKKGSNKTNDEAKIDSVH